MAGKKKGETKNPTEIKFRRALDEALQKAFVGDDQREVIFLAMDEFFRQGRSRSVPSRYQNNQAIKDLDELVATLNEFDQMVRPVLVRNRFTTGQRTYRSEDLKKDGVKGESEPSYGDPTGEDAVFDERFDGIENTLSDLATSVANAKSIAKWILDLSSTDVKERAQKTVPDCMACGEPCLGRVLAGFDEACWKQWTRGGRPDRASFIRGVRERKAAEEGGDEDV